MSVRCDADDMIASCIREAVQTHMQGGRLHLEPELTSCAFNEKQRGDLSDARFDRCEPNKLITPTHRAGTKLQQVIKEAIPVHLPHQPRNPADQKWI
jgi:hypothetical protein